MKATGIVRRVDDLGRFVIPKEIRDLYGWEPGTPLEVFIDGEKVVLRRHEAACVFCGRADWRTGYEYRGRTICGECREAIAAGRDDG